MISRYRLSLCATLLLAACAVQPPAPAPAPTPMPSLPPARPSPALPTPIPTPAKPSGPVAKAPVPAADADARYVPVNWTALPGWRTANLAEGFSALLESCRPLVKRPAWRASCEAAAQVDPGNPQAVRQFYETRFTPHRLSDGDKLQGLVTGYYEPLLRGSRTRGNGFTQPVRGVPDDLLTIDLSTLFPELKDKRVRGRLQGNKVVPYWSRAEISARGDKLPARTLLYVDDAVELFFLQVQGSGRVKLPDGTMARLNYADQNGYPYQSIGRVLVDRGELKLEEASMQGIQAWARANPGRLEELLNANPSYVFFREVPNSKDGPVGALGVPLTAERSIAVDPRSVPLGVPVFLATTRPNSNKPLNRLVLAQDTGGAIKGAVRADFFWGFGKEAGEQAGRMKQSGRMWLLLPPEAVPR